MSHAVHDDIAANRHFRNKGCPDGRQYVSEIQSRTMGKTMAYEPAPLADLTFCIRFATGGLVF